MVVDAVIRHWVTVVAGEESQTKIFGRAVQQLASFYMQKTDYLPSLVQHGSWKIWTF